MSNFDPVVSPNQSLDLEAIELNQTLGLVVPVGSDEETVMLWEELFECIRGEYNAGSVTPSAVQEILQKFNGFGFDEKEIYLESYYKNLESQLDLAGISPQDEDTMSLSNYEEELAKIAETVPEELRDLFYYIHYTQSLGEEMDPEIAKVWEDLQNGKAPDYLAQIRLQEAMNKRNTLNLREQEAPGTQRKFNTVMRPEDIERMLDVKFETKDDGEV